MPDSIPGSGASNRRRARLAAATTGLALAATSISLVATATAAHADAAPVTIRLLGINDFHGRLDATSAAQVPGSIPVRLATLVAQERKEATDAGDAGSLLLSAGDNIGASLFPSAIQKDNPTLDVLNAIGVDVSATGNHEYDKGLSDLTGRVENRADFPYLAANVYAKGTTNPVLQQFATFDVGGVRVGVIGAITQEAPSLVTPSGIAGLDFGDPVAAINRVAGQLSDGDAGNGEADVIVATLHEGASEGTPDNATLATEVAAGGAFANIVKNTSPKVSVIFTGHTHKEYAWTDPDHADRPIIQTGDYGANLGEVDLTYDPTAKTVDTTSPQLLPTKDVVADPSLPGVQQVEDIATATAAYAAEAGNKPVGTITGDITTAYTGGSFDSGRYELPAGTTDPKTGRDQRNLESTMGHLVADAMRGTPIDGFPKADIGFGNAGGLRDELFYDGDTASNPQNTDGVVTYAEANNVLPFLNNVWYGRLKGSDIKTIFEQQWQTDASGNTVTSRPFQNLAISSNVKVLLEGDYTDDPKATQGTHVTQVFIDGKPIDPAKTYTVATFNFLSTGGDNYRAFSNGTWMDTGKVDRDLWIDGFLAQGTKSPDYARRDIYTDAPASVTPGKAYTVHFRHLDLTSLGTPKSTQMTVTAGGTSLATAPIDATGAASVTFTVPATATGAVRLATDGARTTVDLPIAAPAPAAKAVSIGTHFRPKHVVRGRTRTRMVVTVRSAGGAATGHLTVRLAGRAYHATLHGGRAVLRLRVLHKAGVYKARIRYAPTGAFKPSAKAVKVRVFRR